MECDISDNKLVDIVRYFVSQEAESEHVEFKTNNQDSKTIAHNISAITNYMTIHNIPRGYIIWGVDNESHEIVGTNYKPNKHKIGNEEILPWLSKHVKPSPKISFRQLVIDGKTVVVLIIESNPLEVSKCEGTTPYIRIGANTRLLAEYRELEKDLWKAILSRNFSAITAKACLSREEVVALLDYDTFYNMRQNNAPVEMSVLFDESIRCGMVRDNHDKTYDITNLGAILYAKDIQNFPRLVNKMVRIIVYVGDTKLNTKSELRGKCGYIVDFNNMHKYIMESVVSGERINDDGIRETQYLYPKITIRELFANIIAHQDLTLDTLQPMVEIYSDRIEFINPGAPLIPEDRFVDYPPQTRNLQIAEELYKVGICERRGSGWDKVAVEASEYGFSAPPPEVTRTTTRIILTQHKTLSDMTNEERLWSIYIYACLLWVQKKYLTNTLVRQLFNIPDSHMSTASSLINQAIKSGLIVVFDEQSGTRNRKYLPKYAKEEL